MQAILTKVIPATKTDIEAQRRRCEAELEKSRKDCNEAVDALRELLSCCVPTEMDTRTDRAMSKASKIVSKHQSS